MFENTPFLGVSSGRRNLPPHRFKIKKEIAGNNWYRSHMKRHKELNLRQPG
jgi:hypothetical protein